MKKFVSFLFTALLATQAWAATTFTVGKLKYTVIEGTTNVSVSKGSTAPTDALVILEKVTNPNNEQLYTVTGIGNRAFESCSGLTSVTIPNSVTSIDDLAFYNCSSLTSVTIGNSVTNIGNFAFSYCSGLTSVTIGNSVTSIGEYAFYSCSGLKSVTIPNSVTSIGNRAFQSCNSLTSVTIGNSVTSIGEYAFSSCFGLTSVTIGNSVTSIGDCAFQFCSNLTSVTIPNSVTSIGVSAFLSCSKLTEINVESGNTAYSSEDGVLFDMVGTNLICYPAGKTGTTYIIPNSVTSIGSYALSHCSGLTSVTIPNSVTSIGSYAFSSCNGLTSVTIGNSVTSIGEYAFYDCSVLTSVTIGNSVTSIGNAAFFECSGLTSVTIPNSVTSIGNGAFEGCSGLTSVAIPNSVDKIDNYAFSGCSNAILYCETEESAKPEGWNANWNFSDGTVKWGCKVIRAEADNIEYGSVSLGGENNAVEGANGSLWYLEETTNGKATLTAAPNEGYHFVKWTSEGVEDITENPVTLDVSASRTYTAVFEFGAPTSVKYDEQSQINIFAVGKNIIVENADSEIFVTDMAGREVAREMPARRNVISVAASGIYVVKVGKTVKRVLVK